MELMTEFGYCFQKMILQFRRVLFLAFSSVVAHTIDVTGSCPQFTIINNTNLLTGIYYRISLPTSAFSALTYEDAAVTGGQEFVEMDDEAGNEGTYSKGGEWYLDGLWMMKSADQAGYVTIHVAADPDKVIGVTSAPKSPNTHAPKDYYLILISLDELEAGGGRRNQNLIQWKISRGFGSDTYALRNLDFGVKAATTDRTEDFYKWVKLEFMESPAFELFSTQFKFTAVAVEL